MARVTIPNWANPYTAIINGKEYTYPAGAEVDMESAVAEVIQRDIEQYNKTAGYRGHPAGNHGLLVVHTYFEHDTLIADVHHDEIEKAARSGAAVVLVHNDGDGSVVQANMSAVVGGDTSIHFTNPEWGLNLTCFPDNSWEIG